MDLFDLSNLLEISGFVDRVFWISPENLFPAINHNR